MMAGFGQNEQALRYYEQNLAFFLKINVADTAASYSNIGIVYHSQGRYELALENHHKALLI